TSTSTLSLHDALPILPQQVDKPVEEDGVRKTGHDQSTHRETPAPETSRRRNPNPTGRAGRGAHGQQQRWHPPARRNTRSHGRPRSEEHTSELQSRENL